MFNLFTRSLSQFRYGFGGPTGLIYSEVKIIAEQLHVDFSAHFSHLQMLEWAYIEIQAKRAEAQRHDQA